jgi:hypothetical protein
VRLLGTAIVVAAGTSAGAQAAVEAPASETPVNSLAPDSSLVAESYVSVAAPLPDSYGPHPAACDRVGYLRFRSASGPDASADADAILVAQPGIFEGAGAFDQVARHTVASAAAQGRHIEFWALDRRSNCLRDDRGVRAAEAARDPKLALDYYYNGKPVDGQTFAGFTSEREAKWLSHVGLAQTLEDEYAVIRRLPASVRRSKVLCGGHSLGGILTGAFANWDFSGTGDPAQAGYNQCAGYFALDTRLSIALGRQVLSMSLGSALNRVLGSVSNWAPYVRVPPIAPDTLQALPILGMASYFAPEQPTSLLAALPSDPDFNFTFNFLLAGSYRSFLTGKPDPRSFNATNETVLGVVFSDVSEPVGILRASVGIPTGGPVLKKTFPVPYGTPSLAGLVGGNRLVVPAPSEARPGGALYSWSNYDQVPTPGPAPADDPGHPYTSSASQVSDMSQLSRTMFDAPAAFTENYFPTQMVLDIAAAAVGSRSGTLSGMRYGDGIARHPAAYVDASEGIGSVLGLLGPIEAGPQPQVHAVAQGYNHLDVLTSSEKQNNGQPEISSSTLAGWTTAVLDGER